MSDTTDDIHAGHICMQCLTFLISEKGEICDCGHPVHCRECFGEMPRRQQNSVGQYYDEKSGHVIYRDNS